MSKCQFCHMEDLRAVPLMHIVLACPSCNDRRLRQRVADHIRGVYMGPTLGSIEAAPSRRPNQQQEECL